MKYKIIFAYDGTDFFGYQVQPSKRTVQEEIEKVLTKLNNAPVKISASGRTDAKVHANGQVAHFNLEKKFPIEQLKYAMNCLLPPDIYVKEVERVSSNFHARFDCIQKEYIYKINTKEYNPLERNYVYQYNHPLNLTKMKQAIPYLLGTHNFRSFTKGEENKENYIRTIYDIRIEEQENQVLLTFIGSGFLRYMVRNLVGTLIEIGEEKRQPEEINKILQSEDRRQAGKTAPPSGLYLNKVYYKKKL